MRLAVGMALFPTLILDMDIFQQFFEILGIPGIVNQWRNRTEFPIGVRLFRLGLYDDVAQVGYPHAVFLDGHQPVYGVALGNHRLCSQAGLADSLLFAGCALKSDVHIIYRLVRGEVISILEELAAEDRDVVFDPADGILF